MYCSLTDLRKDAKELGMKGYCKLNKEELQEEIPKFYKAKDVMMRRGRGSLWTSGMSAQEMAGYLIRGEEWFISMSIDNPDVAQTIYPYTTDALIKNPLESYNYILEG